MANLKPFCDQIFAAARAAGRREPADAYAADALVAMAEAAVAPGNSDQRSSGPRAMVHVRVDHAALLAGLHRSRRGLRGARGGPVPVATARAWAADAGGVGSAWQRRAWCAAPGCPPPGAPC
ncbi:MAG: hypothetical protein ACR2HY_04305 [Acidimicrobiales bacterium]